MAAKPVILTVRIPDNVLVALDRYARQMRTSRAEVTRQIITDRLGDAQADPIIVAKRVLFMTCALEQLLAAHPDQTLHDNVRRVFEEMTSKGARDAS